MDFDSIRINDWVIYRDAPNWVACHDDGAKWVFSSREEATEHITGLYQSATPRVGITIITDTSRIDRHGWHFCLGDLSYLLEEHSGETFVLYKGRLYEATKPTVRAKRISKEDRLFEKLRDTIDEYLKEDE